MIDGINNKEYANILGIRQKINVSRASEREKSSLHNNMRKKCLDLVRKNHSFVSDSNSIL